MLTDLIIILFFWVVCWVFVLAAHYGVIKDKNNPDPVAYSGAAALIITIIGALIL